MPLTIIIIALVLVLLIIAFKSIRIVQQGHKAAVQSFGRYVGELGPGLHFVTPIKIGRASCRERVFRAV